MFSAWLILLLNGLFFTLRLTGSVGSFPRPLKREEEQECLERFAAGDMAARNKLIEHNLRLVAHIIKKGESGRNILDGQKRPRRGRRISGEVPAALAPSYCRF
ncbi:MAG: hypothetical protein RR606_05180 [Oscillospiraceae bacterium]